MTHHLALIAGILAAAAFTCFLVAFVIAACVVAKRADDQDDDFASRLGDPK